MIDSQIYRNSQKETAADFQEQIGSCLAAEIFSDFVNYDIEDARSCAYSLADETNFNFYVFKKSVDTSVERICTIENGNLASVTTLALSSNSMPPMARFFFVMFPPPSCI